MSQLRWAQRLLGPMAARPSPLARMQPSRTATSSSAELTVDRANVVVIGGGVVGTSIAYHLAKLDAPRAVPIDGIGACPEVVLLEKSELTAGSTWHAAGLTTTFHPGVNMRRVHYDSLTLYTQLEKETGQAVGMHRCGSLRLAETGTRMDEFRQHLSRASWYPAPARILDAAEVVEKCPLINPDGIIGGFFNPHDGYIDPYSVTMALGAGAKQHGAKIFTHTEVTDMESMAGSEGFRWKVTTPNGSIQCRHVVNAAGFWGRELDALLQHGRKGTGAKLPLIPGHHQYCITDTLAEVQALKKEMPVVRDLHGSYYIRMERDGLLVGPYERPERMKLEESWLLDRVTPGFGQELFENDLDRIGPNLEMAVNRFPAFGKAPIIRTVAGPITFAPDGMPMVGPKPGQPGMWLAVGFSYGIIHGGGLGRYLADWIRNGYPPYDLTETDPARYGNWSDDPTYIMNKTKETYGMNNSYAYVKEERFGGRPTKRAGPLYASLQKRGARFGFKAGFEVPLWFERPGDTPGYQPSFHRTNWFEPVGRESRLVRENVGVIDLSSFATFTVSGQDSYRFLNLAFANRIPKTQGRSCLAHMLTHNGRVMSEMTVTCTVPTAKDGSGGEYMLTTGGGSELHDLRWLEGLNMPKHCNVAIRNTTDELSCLGIAGPKSPRLMERLFPGTEFSRDTWKLMSHRKLTNNSGVEMDVIRISYTGELGWEVHCPQASVVDLHATVHRLGADLGVDDFGTYAMNSLRMEKGFRAWGAEMSKDNTMVESDMMSFVRGNVEPDVQACIGMAALEHELRAGSKEKLVMLKVLEDDGKTDPDGMEAVYCDGKVVGHVSSGCYGYQVGHGLAFAFVPPFLAEEGLELEIDVIGKLRRCVVIAPPVKADHLRN
ncbi:dimethylglycine dehydrogenase, mitochondrial-like [Sycon ciliatum]|uniref:dimethylglycine dehydrogenase, mitochondrial-like n=1 Tax=Sycon ciliatum TaxID=27933 RepID=UPI0031F700B2